MRFPRRCNILCKHDFLHKWIKIRNRDSLKITKTRYSSSSSCHLWVSHALQKQETNYALLFRDIRSGLTESMSYQNDLVRLNRNYAEKFDPNTEIKSVVNQEMKHWNLQAHVWSLDMGKPELKWHWSERAKASGLSGLMAVVKNSIHRQSLRLSFAFLRRLLNQWQHSAVGGDSWWTKNILHCSIMTFATSTHSGGQGRYTASAVVTATRTHVIANATFIIILTMYQFLFNFCVGLILYLINVIVTLP